MKKFALFIALAILLFSVQAQNSEKKSRKELKAEKKAQHIAEIKAIVESRNFIFDASAANPMSGSTVSLTTDYEMTIKNDSVFSYLPYYGVAYSGAAFSGNDSPMTFNKPIEEYKSEATKNGYLVKFKVKNANDVINCTFHISESGLTSLSVSSVNRQAINYSGVLIKNAEEKTN